jgi:hypothetical protein
MASGERPTRMAEFESQCPGCLETVYVGDTIGLDEPQGEWMHLDCAEESLPWPDAEE